MRIIFREKLSFKNCKISAVGGKSANELILWVIDQA